MLIIAVSLELGLDLPLVQVYNTSSWNVVISHSLSEEGEKVILQLVHTWINNANPR
jgi:hypothetical protein